MLGKSLMYLLLAQYVIITIVFICERQWNKVLYWVGAGMIQWSVIKM
jgi:hypothetical protein